jgi:hypothetical protein
LDGPVVFDGHGVLMVDTPVELGVVVRVFANQVSTMAVPDPVVIQPRRHDEVAIITLFHGVLVTPTNPLVNTHIHILCKGWSIPFPHLKCGMATPTFSGCSIGKNIVKLHGFNTLLAEFKGGGNLVPPQIPQKRRRVGRFA